MHIQFATCWWFAEICPVQSSIQICRPICGLPGGPPDVTIRKTPTEYPMWTHDHDPATDREREQLEQALASERDAGPRLLLLERLRAVYAVQLFEAEQKDQLEMADDD